MKSGKIIFRESLTGGEDNTHRHTSTEAKGEERQRQALIPADLV